MGDSEILRTFRHTHPRRLRPPEYWAARERELKAQKNKRAKQRAAKRQSN